MSMTISLVTLGNILLTLFFLVMFGTTLGFWIIQFPVPGYPGSVSQGLCLLV